MGRVGGVRNAVATTNYVTMVTIITFELAPRLSQPDVGLISGRAQLVNKDEPCMTACEHRQGIL